MGVGDENNAYADDGKEDDADGKDADVDADGKDVDGKDADVDADAGGAPPSGDPPGLVSAHITHIARPCHKGRSLW